MHINPEIRDRINGSAHQIATSLLGEPNRTLSNSRELRFGRKGSIAVAIAGKRAGAWYDHENADGGDLLALIMREKQIGFPEALSFATAFVGGDTSCLPSPKPSARVIDFDAEKIRNPRLALAIWQSGTDVGGSLVEQYLARRNLILPEGVSGRAIRFHKSCPFASARHPAMLALFRDIRTDEPRAIHRTALTPDGRKIDRRVLGPKTGAAVKLSDDSEVAGGLMIGEGIETTIAGMMLGFSPAWSVSDSGEIAKFPVLAGIEALTIFVDNDKAGQDCASKCSRRWTGAGNEVQRVIPNEPGWDMNDISMRSVA
jgi:hypothetical protein